MAAASLLNAPEPVARPADGGRLTAYLAIFIATLYVRGPGSESRVGMHGRLRPLADSDASALRRAEDYAKLHAFDHFLSQLPPLLDTDGRLCLLLNVCDALLSEAPLTQDRDARLTRLLAALGQSKQRFQPYLDAIVVKNSPSRLGRFDAPVPDDRLTPPMALVVALVCMRSAGSGSGRGDSGGLDACLDAPKVLQDAASRYAARVRLPDFLESAASLLDERQRLCVLLNVCDLMMRERVTDTERSLFRRMRSAFGFEGRAFDPYLNLVLLKNDLPQEGDKRSPEAVVFDRKYQWMEEAATQGAGGSATHDGAPLAPARIGLSAELDQRIARVQARTRQLSSAIGRATASGVGVADASGQALAPPGSPDGDGPADLRAYRDARVSGKGPASGGSGTGDSAPALTGNSPPGDLRTLSDKKFSGAGRHIVDDRSAFGATGRESVSGASNDKTVARMDSVVDRTRTLSDHIEAMLAARSIEEACRIPALPEWGANAELAAPARRARDGNDAHAEGTDPLTAPGSATGTADTGAGETSEAREVGEAGQPVNREAAVAQEQERNDEADRDGPGQLHLLAVDEGGPFVTMDSSPASREDIALNRTLRRLGVLLLPALLLIYGTTLVCEMLSGQAFIENGNLATDARIVHRMASLQHSLHQLSPDPGGIVATAAAFGAEESQLSDHEKASRFLEQRKEELATLSRRHATASAIAAERQHWFATAKSIVLLGLGMALWGMLFRSKRMMHASALTGMASVLLCANGYWLWVRF